jgi:hypothetical protein
MSKPSAVSATNASLADLAFIVAGRRAADVPTAKDLRLLRRWIDAVSMNGKVEASPPGDAPLPSRHDALTALAEFLSKNVVQPIRLGLESALHTGGDGPPAATATPHYLAGHERFRAARRLAALVGPSLATQTYAALVQVAIDREAAEEDRVRAIDLLNEIGVGTNETLLSTMVREIGDDPLPSMQCLQACAKIKAGTAGEPDIRVLREAAAANAPTSRDLQLLCLESLCLANQTAGLEPLIEALAARDADDVGDLTTRCMFALGCSDEGRAALLKICQGRRPPDGYRTAFFLLESSVRRSDPEWDQCLEIAEAVALDEAAALDLRVKASEIAWNGGAERPFRAAFLHGVLASNQARHFPNMDSTYFGINSGGQRYAHEFADLARTTDIETRRWAARAFCRSCDKKLSPRELPEVKKAIVAISDSHDFGIEIGVLILWDNLYRNHRNPMFELLPTIVGMAKRQENPEQFSYIVNWIARTLKRRLPINPKYDDNGVARSREEMLAIVAKDRATIEAALEQWAQESTTANR